MFEKLGAMSSSKKLGAMTRAISLLSGALGRPRRPRSVVFEGWLASVAKSNLKHAVYDVFAGVTETQVKHVKPQPRFEEAVLWSRTADLWWK